MKAFKGDSIVTEGTLTKGGERVQVTAIARKHTGVRPLSVRPLSVRPLNGRFQKEEKKERKKERNAVDKEGTFTQGRNVCNSQRVRAMTVRTPSAPRAPLVFDAKSAPHAAGSRTRFLTATTGLERHPPRRRCVFLPFRPFRLRTEN
jgi:hypothetical protein